VYDWDEKWLLETIEPVVDPDLAIVDPHHHLWDFDDRPRYLLGDLQADTSSGHRVVGTVYCQCRWSYRTTGPERELPLGETETVAAIAAHSARTGSEILGVVGHADLALGDELDDLLSAHIDAGCGRFRGIRHSTVHDPDPDAHTSTWRPPAGLMGRPAFVAGVRRLAARHLVYDAWLYHHQMGELVELARQVPEATIVLDHLGGMLGIGRHEGHRAGILEEWRGHVVELASCANVRVKLGGIGMAILGLGFERQPAAATSDELVEAWAGPITHVIEHFGADRCMFESNFPVDKESTSYVNLWNAFKKMTASASSSERAALFSGTARAVYQV
jgi:predicted TIM-barrel fold metal-dependent hydrolase